MRRRQPPSSPNARAPSTERFAITGENAPVVAEICARLDGIPLAIELAASRAAVLSPKQIAEKLDERFRLLAQKGGDRLPRQQTLRALIDWSYELLDDDERAVFARLSSFVGGWTLAAASAVCADDAIDEWQVLDNLSALVTKSLVVAEPGGDERRYRMLNTIHEYGREQLSAIGQRRCDCVKARRILRRVRSRTVGVGRNDSRTSAGSTRLPPKSTTFAAPWNGRWSHGATARSGCACSRIWSGPNS